MDIMTQDRCIIDKFNKLRKHIPDRWRLQHHLVCDPRELGNKGRNSLTWVDQLTPLVFYPMVVEFHTSYLKDGIFRRI